MRLSARSRALVAGVATAGLLVTYAITGAGDPATPPETSPESGNSSPTTPAPPTPAPVPDDGPRERRDDSTPRAPAPPAQEQSPPASAPVLAEPTPAAEALPQLTAEQLESSAAAVGRTVREYRDLVTNDSAYWLDRGGATYVVDPLPEPAAATAPNGGEDEGAPAGPEDSPGDSVDLSEIDVMKLHSNPESTLKLFIDVVGGEVPQGNGLNGGWQDIIPDETYPAWTPKADGATAADKDRFIHDVWEAVAADYAPFDIDVTTEDPGPAGINRSDEHDKSYGATIALTDPSQGGRAACRCVGLAYVNTFADISPDSEQLDPDLEKPDGYRLGFVFPRGIGDAVDDVDGVAQAVSHEAGHILGLTHDGTLDSPWQDNYYVGHGHWNSIMGIINPDHPLTQWSKGDYPDANNQQDDVAILADRLPHVTDDIGDSRETAATMIDGFATGLITSPDDVDVHYLGSCAGDVTIEAAPTALRSNLDIELTLLDGAGMVLPPVNPANTVDEPSSQERLMQGLDARIETTLDEGDYWVQVRGGSNRTWATGGYDAYGSTGAYELRSDCSGSSATQTTTVLTAEGDAEATTLTATTTRPNEAPVAGSVTFRRSGIELETVPLVDGQATHTLSGLPPGTYLFSADFTPIPLDETDQTEVPEPEPTSESEPEPANQSRSQLVEHRVPGESHLTVKERHVDGNDVRLVLAVGPTAAGTLDVAVDGEDLDQPIEVEETTVTVELTDLTLGPHWIDLTHELDDVTSAVHALLLRVERPDLRPKMTLDVDGTDGVRILEAAVETAGEPVAGHVEFYADGAPVATEPLVDGRATVGSTEFAQGVHMFGAVFIPDDDSVSLTFATDVLAPATVSVQPSVVKNKIKLDVSVGPRDRGKLEVLVSGESHVVDVWRKEFTTRIGAVPAGNHTVQVTFDPETGDPTTAPTFAVKVPKLAPKVKVKAPKQKRRGKRAKLTVKVRSKSAVSGKVRVKTKGWKKTVKLNRKGNVKVKTPKLRKGKKQRFVVRYLGNANTLAKRTKVVIKIRG